MAGVRRLGRTAWIFGEIRQVCRSQGDPLLNDFRGSERFPSNDYPSSPLGGATEINAGGIENRLFRGAPNRRTKLFQASSGATRADPFFVRVPPARPFTPPARNDTGGLSIELIVWLSRTPFATLRQPELELELVDRIPRLVVVDVLMKDEARSMRRVEVPGNASCAPTLKMFVTSETVKAYPIGR